MIARRSLGLGLAGAWPAGAQTRMPCGPGVPIMLEGTGAPAGSVTVFGQVFKPGEIQEAMGLTARLADGRPLLAQIDVKNRHPDGSARMAVVALACPALAQATRVGVLLAPGPAEYAAPPELGGHRAVLELRGAQGAWEADLLASLRAVPGPPWQMGRLVAQARVALAVPANVVGVASLRVLADIGVRMDGTLWVDLWLRNDVAMQPNGGETSYSARLLLDGRLVLEANIPRHHQYTGWGRLVGTGPTPPLLRHDATYLADAAAVARYDTSTGVEEALLAQMGQAMAAPAWRAAFSPRHITQNMGQTGGRADIGPATMPQAAWLISGDRRAGFYAIGQAEAAAGIPWHFWDGRAGTWVDTNRWPRLWSDSRGGPAPGGLLQPIASDTGWACDSAHQPDLSFLPFLLTARRAFLDNLQAQASWCVIGQWPGLRGTPGPQGEGVNVVRGNQVRGAAWSLRQLENAAWASPEGDANRAWLRAAANGNWAWIQSQIPAWTAQQGEAHGWIRGEYGTPGALPPWQQDYFASTAAIAARRGDGQARAVLEWMTNFLVGRFNAERQGFARHDGAAYLIAIGTARPWRSWAEIGAATRQAGLSNGTGWSQSGGNYAQLALASLAAIADTLRSPSAAESFAWLSRAGAPFTRLQDFARDPGINIVPRGLARGSQAGGCAHGGPPQPSPSFQLGKVSNTPPTSTQRRAAMPAASPLISVRAS